MDDALIALADPVRWRLAGLLAERPRPVGVLADLAGARQPQTTKHLQVLERAGVVTSLRTGQRRIYALRPGALRDLAAELARLADDAERAGGPLETYDRYGRSLAAERLATNWDGRAFTFTRTLAVPPETVWRHLTEAELLTRWWAPDDLRLSEMVLEARPGGRVVQEYRDAEDPGVVAGRAEGVVENVRPGVRLALRLSPQLPGGGDAFTAHLDFTVLPDAGGSSLAVDYRVSGSSSGAADFIAGIEIGFGQSLDRLAHLLERQTT